jgi:hypothetical protein
MSAYLPAAAAVRRAPAHIPVRVYTISPFWKAVYIFLGAAIAMGGSMGAAYFLFDEGAPGGDAGKALAAACGAFVLLGCSAIVHVLVYKFFLGPTEIAVSGFMYRRRMRRTDVLGRRTRKFWGITATKLFSVRKESRRMVLMQNLKTDRVYHNWLAAIPDLDKRDTIAATSEVLENPEFGRTAEHRERVFTSAHVLAGVLNGLLSVVAVWFLFFPKPYEFLLAVTAAMPLIAVAMAVASKGLFALDRALTTEKGGLPSLNLFFMLPAIAFAVRGWLDGGVLDWKIALIASLAAGAAMSGAVVSAVLGSSRTRRRPFGWLVIGAVVVIWCSGGVVFANSLFDRGSPRGYEAKVVGKRQSLGKLRTLRFTLEPWGPVASEWSVAVSSQALYDRIALGDTVCVILHPGAFRIRWVEVWGCR